MTSPVERCIIDGSALLGAVRSTDIASQALPRRWRGYRAAPHGRRVVDGCQRVRGVPINVVDVHPARSVPSYPVTVIAPVPSSDSPKLAKLVHEHSDLSKSTTQTSL